MKRGRLLRWIVAAVVAVGVGWMLMVGQLPRSEAEREVVRLAEVGDCQLHQGPCETLLPDGTIAVFELGPRPLSSADPLDLQLRLSSPLSARVEVIFEGREMYMGMLRYRLQSSDGGNSFQGRGGLSICTRSLMLWRATVVIEQATVRWELPFLFETLMS